MTEISSATGPIPSAPSRDQQPWAPPGFWRLNGINTFWAANQGLWNAIYVLLAISAALTSPNQKELVVGRAAAAGGVLGVFVPIATGWLSDRTNTRWGRRTPWIVAGALVSLVGLLLLAWAPSVPALVAAFLVLQLGNNAAGAAFAGIVPDVVPEERRGGASGLLNSATIVGTVVCLAITLVVLGRLGSTTSGVAASYLIIAALVALSLVWSIRLLREPASTPAIASRDAAGPGGPSWAAALRGALASGWRQLLASHDFRWVITTRFFQTLGIWTILPFISFYFKDIVRTANYGAASALWQLCVLAGGLAPAVIGGFLSDRLRRRKIFVYVSCTLQGLVVAVLLFTLVSNTAAIYLMGLVFGVGYGVYSSVDWALACDVLPDRERSAARDMGIFHVSYTLPQVFAPALLAPVLYWLNQPGSIAGLPTGSGAGYRAVFASATIWFLLATVMVSRIRGVR
jgi:MFS family permease